MAAKRPGYEGQLRIIGGSWRGRKLHFAPAPGLRPTPDRVRETLFNWLAPWIHGVRCLDLFAGSGALGLEALSRGAEHCVFVDSHAQSVSAIEAQLQILDCAGGTCRCDDALAWLENTEVPTKPFDIVFLDPPFEQKLLTPSCQALEARGWLAGDARIYLEAGAREADSEVPANWELSREKLAGDVRYRLFVRPE